MKTENKLNSKNKSIYRKQWIDRAKEKENVENKTVV